MTPALPTSMRAIAIARAGGPEVLTAVQRPVPLATATDVLIAVEAAGINQADLLQRRGESPSALARPDVPGLEVAGRIAAIGNDVRDFKVGDRVCALLAGGGYAEFAVAPAVQVLPLPGTMSYVDGAALPEALFTSWSALVDSARMGRDDIVLVHGGASGIGTIAIQLARLIGATVFATAGSEMKCAACRMLGAAHTIDYRSEDFGQAVMERTDGRGADVILDMVGGDYVMRNIRCLARGGRIINIAFQQGAVTTVDLLELQRRNGSLLATMLRPRPPQEKGAIAASLREHVWPAIETGRVRAVVHRVLPLADASTAHTEFERAEHIGKFVLQAS